MQWPVEVALARPTPTLPSGPGWSYEIKVDGHRTVLWRAQDTVRLQSRSGRDVTSPWMDLARAGTALPPGVILDGEAVVIVDDAVSFEAAQARAASSPSRARRLAERYPALLIVWDVLALPTGDVRARPYTWRRAALLDLVANLPDPSPIQAVSATADLALAQSWYDSLQGAGAEGIVAKPTASPTGPAVRPAGRRHGTPRRWTPRSSATRARRGGRRRWWSGSRTDGRPCPNGSMPASPARSLLFSHPRRRRSAVGQHPVTPTPRCRSARWPRFLPAPRGIPW